MLRRWYRGKSTCTLVIYLSSRRNTSHQDASLAYRSGLKGLRGLGLGGMTSMIRVIIFIYVFLSLSLSLHSISYNSQGNRVWV